MTIVELLFWRAVTPADFFNVERKQKYSPPGGGGQTYFSVSFSGLTYAELDNFLSIQAPDSVETTRPQVTLRAVRVASDPPVEADITFRPRYLPPKPDDRYRIATQNRQYPRQLRHPAWTDVYGFPRASDQVSSTLHPSMPDLTYLKIWVARLVDGSYAAGFFNRATPPANLAGVRSLDVLFQENSENPSAGVIDLSAAGIALDVLAAEPSSDWSTAEKAPEVLEASDATTVAAGRPPSGQGYRTSAVERQAIEQRAVEMATMALRADKWRVEDVGLYRPYDLHCRRGSEEKRVEVKGTTGDGSTILLTPNEVVHAREHSNVALMVVSGIVLKHLADGTVIASGGTLTVHDPWDIDAHGVLAPTGYAYGISPSP